MSEWEDLIKECSWSYINSQCMAATKDNLRWDLTRLKEFTQEDSKEVIKWFIKVDIPVIKEYIRVTRVEFKLFINLTSKILSFSKDKVIFQASILWVNINHRDTTNLLSRVLIIP